MTRNVHFYSKILQSILIVACCFLALGSGTELDFIEYEVELEDGFIYGDGWKRQGEIADSEEMADWMDLKSGRSSGSSSDSSSSNSDSDSDDDKPVSKLLN